MGSGAYTSRYLERDLAPRPTDKDAPQWYEQQLAHLLTHLRHAQLQIRRRDAEVDGPHESLAQATAVMGDLIASVDCADGGEATQRLAAVYAYLGAEITAVRRTLDQEQLARTIELVASLHESWVIAARTQWPAERPAGAVADSSHEGHAHP